MKVTIAGKELKKQCYSCKLRSDTFTLWASGIPHCQCWHESITAETNPWDSLRTIFDGGDCEYYKRRK